MATTGGTIVTGVADGIGTATLGAAVGVALGFGAGVGVGASGSASGVDTTREVLSLPELSQEMSAPDSSSVAGSRRR